MKSNLAECGFSKYKNKLRYEHDEMEKGCITLSIQEKRTSSFESRLDERDMRKHAGILKLISEGDLDYIALFEEKRYHVKIYRDSKGYFLRCSLLGIRKDLSYVELYPSNHLSSLIY